MAGDLVATLIHGISKKIPNLPSSLQGLGWAALDTIYEHREIIEQTTKQALISAAAHIALGARDKARAEWVKSLSDVNDWYAALDAASDEAQAAAKSRADSFELFEDFLIQFLKSAGAIALPLLLG